MGGGGVGCVGEWLGGWVVCTHFVMYAWMDGWMDGWMDDGWMGLDWI